MIRKLRRAFCIMLCLILLLCGSVGAVTQSEIDELEARRDELQQRQERLDEQLEAMEQGLENSLAQKAALDEQSALLQQETELLSGQIELYESLIADKKAEAEAAEAARDEHYALYCSRVRDMEEGSAWDYLAYIFKADSVAELISRITDISDIMSYDESLREDYLAACDRAAEALEEYRDVQEAQRAKRAEFASQQKKLEEKIAASAAVIAEMEADMDAYMAYDEEVAAEMAHVQAEIDQKAEELRKQQEAEAAAKNPVPVYPSAGSVAGGYYMWPSATTYISSNFGPRVHPIYGQLKPHTGVDIGAWYGTEIYAAASGTVTAAVLDYGSVGYGTYVAIYHPNGTTTLYGHMSALAVSPGQTVTQGQVIGYVGSTGASNGPHIHFEVRVNGVCTDPMQYF